MQKWFWNDGAFHHDTGDKLPKGASRVPRAPQPGEIWDGKRFVRDAAAAASHNLPAGHVEAAHLLKQAEAALVLSGHALTHGLLAEEAATLGLSVTDLARVVHDRAAAFRALEVSRRTAKAEGTDA